MEVLKDGQWKRICDTCEDTVRPQGVKVMHETAIPQGRYLVQMDIVSPKYSNFTKYPWAKEYGGKIPRLKDVPMFEGILIHVGNRATHSSGCILVGENKMVGQVLNSTATFHRLMKQHLLPARQRGEKIWITVIN
jgi:hypothetical protein